MAISARNPRLDAINDSSERVSASPRFLKFLPSYLRVLELRPFGSSRLAPTVLRLRSQERRPSHELTVEALTKSHANREEEWRASAGWDPHPVMGACTVDDAGCTLPAANALASLRQLQEPLRRPRCSCFPSSRPAGSNTRATGLCSHHTRTSSSAGRSP